MTGRPRIVFVDDEPRILDALRRMLRPERHRWEITFAEGAAAALEALADSPADVVVTDFRMPGMDGAQLLEIVRNRYPETTRIVLSGQTDESNVLKLLTLAHEMLSKPTVAEELIATIDRLLSARLQAARPWRDVVTLESLPDSPQAVLDLIAAIDSEDASAAMIGGMVKCDPAAAARILRLVNSSAFSVGRRITDISQAVAILGLDALRGLMLMEALVTALELPAAFQPDWTQRLTQHSIETSRLARLLAGGRPWQSQAFTAGLLHEAGQLVLAATEPAAYAAATEAWHEGSPGPDLADGEQETLGASHLNVGASLFQLWGLPDVVVESAALHTMSPPGPVTDVSSAVALAHLVVEAELQPVCGAGGRSVDDILGELDEAGRAAVEQWRRDRTAS